MGYLSFQERQGMLKHGHTSHWECASPLLLCSALCWQLLDTGTTQYPALHFLPILFTKKEQGSRKVQLTLLPLSQMFMYLFTEKVSSREQPHSYHKDSVKRGKIAREDLEKIHAEFSICFTKTYNKCFNSGSNYFFPNEILLRSCCTYTFWQSLMKEPDVTFLQGLKYYFM